MKYLWEYSSCFIIGMLILAVMVTSIGCHHEYKYNIGFYNTQGKAIKHLEVGQTLIVGVKNIPAHSAFKVTLRGGKSGELIRYFQLRSNSESEILPTVLWHHSGIIDRRVLDKRKRFYYEFSSIWEADSLLSGRVLNVNIETTKGEILNQRELKIVGLTESHTPLFYFSDENGNLRNSFDASRQETAYLTISNDIDADSVAVFLVPSQRKWSPKMQLSEIREKYQRTPQVITLDNDRPFSTIKLGSASEDLIGAYDVIVRRDISNLDRAVLASDLYGYFFDTGILFQLVYNPPWAPNDFDIAGRLDKNFGYPYFEFHDVFEVGESMWGAVDPAMIPATHPGGRYGGYYVINHGSASSGLSDLTSEVEIMPIKSGCINGNMTEIWNNPNPEGEYDIVVDFGSTTAMAKGDWAADNTFNVGVDFIDRSTNIGAYVVKDPSLMGPFSTIPYRYEPASTSSSDPLRTDVSSYFNSPDYRVSENMNSVPLQGVGYYPSGSGPFPLVLIVHGNHNPTHASQTGYDYLCQLLASHGMIAISVDENFLNGNTTGEIDARAIVLLRHLQKWREWNSTSGNIFYNKVDLSKIGLSGHSRGGEAIIVANLFNSNLHNATDPLHNFDFNIQSLFAIAPVDGQIESWYFGVPIVTNNADYYIMHGSHDGDVFTMGGQKAYDRAFPNAAAAGGFKGLLFIHGANHNYWNTEWASHSNDGTRITSPLSQISAAGQQAFGKVYISAYFQLTLLDKTPYVALLTGDLTFNSLPSDITLIHQYCDQDRIDLNTYEEDHVDTTGTFTGVTNNQSGLSVFSDQDISGSFATEPHCGSDSPYNFWGQTSGLIAGWNSSGTYYEVNLPAAIGGYVNSHPYLSFRIGQVYEEPTTPPSSLNNPGDNQDMSVVLELGTVNAHSLKVSNFDDLPYPIETIWNYPYISCSDQFQATKSIMKTVRIPLRSFTVNKSDWDLADVSKIKIKFNKMASGLIVLDDIQLTK